MGLMEQRHPTFGRLLALWRASQRDAGPPPASALGSDDLKELASATVTLQPDAGGNRLVIAASGDAVDALYGVALTGDAATRLSPEREDAEREAREAIVSGRPLLIEDELRTADRRRRIARLYLPMSNDDGSPDGVLCGVVSVA